MSTKSGQFHTAACLALLACLATAGCARGVPADAHPSNRETTTLTLAEAAPPGSPRDASAGGDGRARRAAAELRGVAPGTARAATAEEVARMRASVLAYFAESEHAVLLPSSVRILFPSVLLRAASEPVVLALVHSHPETKRGANCSPALYWTTTDNVEIVSTPWSDVPGCQRPRLVSREDLNDDGVPDFAFAADLRSNRYDVMVEEGRVILSTDADIPYCFAPALGAIAQTQLGPRGFRAAVDAERTRLGDRVLDCWKETADAGAGGWALVPSK